MTTREQFLTHIHQPLQNAGENPPRSSSTKSAYRVHWRVLSEWIDFPSEAQTYWNSLDDSEKNTIVRASPDYWLDTEERLRNIFTTFSREPHLSTPFDLLYAEPHNRATNGHGNGHARITTQVPETAVDLPDLCFRLNNDFVGVAEIKTSWNLTESSIEEVLQGFLHTTRCR